MRWLIPLAVVVSTVLTIPTWQLMAYGLGGLVLGYVTRMVEAELFDRSSDPESRRGTDTHA